MSHDTDSFPLRLIWLFFLALIGLCVSSLVLFSFVSTTNIAILKWLQILQTLLTFAVPSGVYWYMYREHGIFSAPRNINVWLIAILLMPCSIPGINLTQWLNEMMQLPGCMQGIEQWMKQMEEQTAALTEQFLKVEKPIDYAFNLLVMAIVPAIAEEFFFRGCLQKLLSSKLNAHLAIWITAIVFSAIHLQFYGFFPRMLLGAALGYLFWYTGSIWTNVLAHFINNALAVTFAAYTFGVDFENLGTNNNWWIGAISIFVATALILGLAHTTAPKKG